MGMGGGGNRPLVKRRASLQRLCQVRLYRAIPGRLEMRCPAPGSQPLSSQACGGIRPVAFVHAAKSGWRKKATALAAQCGTSVWWRFSGYRPARLRPCWRRRRTACRATPTRALCRTTICRRSRRFALHWSRAIEASTLWRTFTVLSGRAAPKRLRRLTSQQRKVAGTCLGLKADAQQAGPLLRGGQ